MLTRNPIAIVVSAYDYHRKNKEPHWTGVPLPLVSDQPVVKTKGLAITLNASFLGCLPNRSHLFFPNLMHRVLAAMQNASHMLSYSLPNDASGRLSSSSFSNFLIEAPLRVGMLTQLLQSRPEVCEIALAHARTNRSSAHGVVLNLESFANRDSLAAKNAWLAFHGFLRAHTGCSAHTPSEYHLVEDAVRGTLASRLTSTHSQKTHSSKVQSRMQLARQLDRYYLAGWYHRMSKLMGYAEPYAESGGGVVATADEVLHQCRGLHPDADTISGTAQDHAQRKCHRALDFRGSCRR